jgi:flagellar basal body-associated protein FliL
MQQAPASRSKLVLLLLALVVVAVVVAVGLWYFRSGAANTNQPTTTVNNNEPNPSAANGSWTFAAKNNSHYELKPPPAWQLATDDSTIHATGPGDVVVNLTVRGKTPDEALAAYVNNQTGNASVGEGSYETPEPIVVNTIPGIRVLGQYAGRIVRYFFELSTSEVLEASAGFQSQDQLDSISSIIGNLRRNP